MLLAWSEWAGEVRLLDSAGNPPPHRVGAVSMEEQLEKAPRRTKRSKWRMSVWAVLVGGIAFLSIILTMGFFRTADFVLQLEAFAGFFVLGCVFLLVSRRSATKKQSSDL